MLDLPWRNIWSADNPVEVMNEHLLLLVGCFVPTNVILLCNKLAPTRISLGLMINAGMLLASSRRLIFGLSGKKSLSSVKRELMKLTRRLSVRLVSETDVLINPPHKWWSTLKSAVFGLSSSLPLRVGANGGLVCESVGKADLPSDYFDCQQSRESVHLKFTCHLSP